MSLNIKENEPLKNHSTFRIGGLAKYFVVVKNREEILEAIKFAEEKKLPYVVIGSGSNILFRDEGFDGVAIKMGPHPQPLSLKERGEGVRLVAPAGILLSQLVNFATENNLTGLEWGIGIPGTIGGCVAGNCGAFGKSISESVKKIKTLDKEYSKEECEFSYRQSKFKNFSRSDLDGKKVRPLPEIILEVELELKQDDKEKIRETIKNNLTQRKNRIPQYPSIGCIFKNPKPLSAGKLIEQCGLRGERIGDAQISETHANFIVNLGEAKAQDVFELIKLCKEKVKEKFNLDLKEEIVVI